MSRRWNAAALFAASVGMMSFIVSSAVCGGARAQATEPAQVPQAAPAGETVQPVEVEDYSVVRPFPSLRRRTVVRVPLGPATRVRGPLVRGGPIVERAPDQPEDWVVAQDVPARGMRGATTTGVRVQAVDVSSDPGYALLYLDRETLLEEGTGPRSLRVGVRTTQAEPLPGLRGVQPAHTAAGAAKPPAGAKPGGQLGAQPGGQPAGPPVLPPAPALKGGGTRLPLRGLFENLTLRVNPGQVPSQKLINGTSKTVIHFGVNLEDPELREARPGTARRLYFVSDNLLSTEPLDRDAKLDVRLGGLWRLGRLAAPPEDEDQALKAELRVGANQPASDASLVAGVGVKNPWGKRWLSKQYVTPLLYSDANPLVEFNVCYENRFREDPRISSIHANRNSMQLFGQFHWDTLHLFPGRHPSPGDLSLELLACGWFFPYDRASGIAKVRTFEGRLEASLLIPFGLPFFARSPNGPATRLRIRFVDGADQFNHFVRSSYVTFGLEAVKLN